MVECQSPKCEARFIESIQKIEKAIFGVGPEGNKGVYGILMKKVSYKAFSVFMGVALLILGWTMIHEGRISKSETIISSLCEDVKAFKAQNDKNTKEIINVIKELKK